jgi:hypothetical protein
LCCRTFYNWAGEKRTERKQRREGARTIKERKKINGAQRIKEMKN